jgi:hypothetical protein
MEAIRRHARKVMLAGDYRHSDFDAVRAFLAAAPNIDVIEMGAVNKAASGGEIIAICQSRPGQLTQSQIESLHACAPLARLLAILGSWCEGEMRSGQPWHGVERVYWYDAVGRLRWLLASGTYSAASRTQTAAERIESSTRRWPQVKPGASAAIFTLRRSEYEPLADVCRALQLSPRWEKGWQPLGIAPQFVIVAIDDLQAGVALDSLAAMCNGWPDTKRIALLNFPRRSEVELLKATGFHHVLGKPLLIADLLGCLPGMWVERSQRQTAAS